MPAFRDALNAAALAWSDRIWAVVWQSTILVVAVALVAGLVLRRSSPSVRYWVWQILALKILLMPFWAFAIPLPQFVPRQFAEPANVAPRPIVPGPVEELPPGSAHPPAAGNALVTSEPTPAPDSPIASSVTTQLSWPAWLFVGWGLVVFAQVIRLTCQRRRLGRLLRQSQPADAGVAGVVDATARQLGLPVVPQAVLTDADCSPFVCGIRCAVIVLPRPLATTLTPVELRHVVAHELAHVKRRDLVWGWIGEVARVVYFFHPVVHWLCYRMRLERELACDTIAMALTGQNAGEYAATLVRVVSQSSEPTVFKTAAASASFSGETQ